MLLKSLSIIHFHQFTEAQREIHEQLRDLRDQVQELKGHLKELRQEEHLREQRLEDRLKVIEQQLGSDLAKKGIILRKYFQDNHC